MSNFYTVGAVVLCLLIIVFLLYTREGFDVEQDLGLRQTDNSQPVPASQLRSHEAPYVRLYEDYQQKELAFEFAPESGHGTYRQVMPLQLKHIEAYLPKDAAGPYAQVRRIAIWSVYGGIPNASILSDFYNAYLEPDTELKANPAKYKKLVELAPGDRVSLDVTEPTKRIFLYAIM